MPSNESGTQDTEANQNTGSLSPEMMRKLIDRVYQLLKEEARIEHERFRPTKNHQRFAQGGR